MKNKTFTLLRATTLLFACCFLIGIQIIAQISTTPQIPLGIDDLPLNKDDLSGTYVLQTPGGQFLSPYVATNSNSFTDSTAIAFSNPNWAMDIVKQPDGTYTIQWGDIKANYNHRYLMRFDNTETANIFWKITLLTDIAGQNTVTIQRRSSDPAYDLLYWKVINRGNPLLNRVFTNGLSSNAANIVLHTVTSKRPVVFPVAKNYTFVRNALNPGDLSGTYLIQNRVGQFMTPNLDTSNDHSVLASVAPTYAFTLTKTLEGSYTINSGDFQATYADPWLVSFQVQPDLNTWNINVVDGDSVTIQKNDNSGYLKNEMNPAVTGPFKFYNNGSSSDDVKYVLQTITGEAPNGISQTYFSEEINGNVFQNLFSKELKITNISNVNSIDIYNIKGQKIFGCKVKSTELSISFKGWNNGIYLVRLSNNNGVSKNIKTIVN